MKIALGPLFLASLGLCSPSAQAQTGIIDQISPAPTGSQSAGFNAGSAGLIWQSQVRVGMTGRLEGFDLSLSGPIASQVAVGLHLGNGWSSTPLLFQTIVSKNTLLNNEVLFVDATPANLDLTAGSTFVIEIFGIAGTPGLNGSYVAPPGAPLYPEPMFLNGGGCYGDCGWRIAFTTYMLPPPLVPFCAADGLDPQVTTACPCANPGAPGHGCANSVNSQGALLTASGSINPDTVVLLGSGMPATVAAIYIKGDVREEAVFGDGLRCAGGFLIRLKTKINSGGASQYPESGDPSLSVRGSTPPGSGLVGYYQVYYRNSAAGFCPPATFNISNGIKITW